jgi:hypothetical protein
VIAWLHNRRRPRVMVAKSSFIVRGGGFGGPVFYVQAGQCFVASHHLVKSHRRYFKREAKHGDPERHI